MAKRFLTVILFLLLACPPSGWTAASQVRISVFNFATVNMEASGLGATVTNMLIGLLAEDARLSMLDRKELESFLSMNDLQQNDQMDNVVNVGTRLGLSVVVFGSVEKKGSMITVLSKAIQIGQKKLMFNTRVVAVGEAALGGEMRKLSQQIRKAVAEELAREKGARGDGLRRARRVRQEIGEPEHPPALGGASGRGGSGLRDFSRGCRRGPLFDAFPGLQDRVRG